MEKKQRRGKTEKKRRKVRRKGRRKGKKHADMIDIMTTGPSKKHTKKKESTLSERNISR